jgi:hypothetical protein
MSAPIAAAGLRHVRSGRSPSGDREFASEKQPASAKRVHLKWSREEIAEFARRVRDIHSENR